MASIRNVTIDCADPDRLAPFWQAATGLPVLARHDNEVILSAAPAARPRLILIRVPEPKTAKNRVHLDLETPDLEAETARLVGLGATRHATIAEHGVRWTVLTDPVGNEFCLVEQSPS
jgi:predicted enzyme related to lactoylglutathione lyase